MTPNPADFFPLDAEAVHTRYLKRKAARLASEQVNDHRRVIYRDHLSSATTKVFSVWGDSGVYRVWLKPATWQAACSRGGIHDHQREGQACSHGLAAAVAWLLIAEQADEVLLETMSEVDDPVEWEEDAHV
jgi:hypothetical protein